MDQEIFWLLMQVMYGDHHQRQKANFKLRRKGVSNKIRLKAKHKGPGARLSLKRALRDAIHRYEFEQRHKHPHHTASAFSTRTKQNRSRRPFQNRQQHGRSPMGGPPQMDPHAPMRTRGTISQYEPNGWERTNEWIDSSVFPIRFAGNMVYDILDDGYLTIQTLLRDNRITDLEGSLVPDSHLLDSGINTLLNIIPYTKAMKVLRLKGLNAAQFSKMYKGTFIPRLKPATRGFINRMYNKYIHTPTRIQILKGIRSLSPAAGSSSENDTLEVDKYGKHRLDYTNDK